MKNSGFILKELYLLNCDSGKKSSVSFEKGLNVIFGPSEKGKTFIFQCIKFLLGSNEKPKKIPEAKGFSKCYLKIKTYENKFYILERALGGGDISLHEIQNDTIINSRILDVSNSSKKETISDFLLDICNLQYKKIRKNSKGNTLNMYFQDLFTYFMINEKEIITDESPIAKITTRESINTKKTFQENRFRFLMTGKDDSAIVVPLNEKVVENKKGKIELLNDLIKKISSGMSENLTLSDIENQISKLDESICFLNKEYLVKEGNFIELENKKNFIYSNILKNEKRLNILEETLKRSEILDRQYKSDIERLRATIEAGKAMNSLEDINCPVCNSIVDTKKIVDIELVSNASLIEINKINSLIVELGESSKNFILEKKQIVDELSSLRFKYNNVIKSMKTECSNLLTEISDKISVFNTKREALVIKKNTINYIDELVDNKESIEKVIENNKLCKDKAFDKFEASHVQNINDIIFSILKIMNFECLGDSIGFSEELNDFIIAHKNRKDFGKGYRAVLYGVFIIALQKYLERKEYKIGFSIIDSPLNPYKPNESDDGRITTNLASNFYDYLYKNITTQQVIIIENTVVPDEISKNINYIKYSKDNGFL